MAALRDALKEFEECHVQQHFRVPAALSQVGGNIPGDEASHSLYFRSCKHTTLLAFRST